MLGTGRAEAITDRDIALLADELSVHPADIEAISEVESNGFGWFPDGRIKILFEKHKFYRYVPIGKRAAAVKAGLARKEWVSPQKGGYSDQGKPGDRYALLAKAMNFDEEAAFLSISMGRFQIMGFNHATCGFASARAMFDRFVDSEANQLRAFVSFLKANNLVPAIRARDFAKVETVYNGGGLGGTYAKKMKQASDRLRAGKWSNYKPGSFSTAEPAPKPAPKPAPELEPAPTPAAVPSSTNLASLIASLFAKFFEKWKGA